MRNIHPTAVIEKDVNLAEDVTIGPNCVVCKGTTIGEGSHLYANVYIGPDVVIGKNNQFFPTCSIGTNPQILGLKSDTKVGKLTIGDGNTIREQATIHPSMHPGEYTKVGSNNLIMIGVHIGHDCVLEDKIVMSNYVQISGHCHIQTGAWLSGMVLSHQFVTIGKWCYASGLTGINHDIPPFLIVSGHYPPKVRGVNKRGMDRAGLTELQQKAVMRAYRQLYRTEGALLEKVKTLAQQPNLEQCVKDMLEIILNSTANRHGRYLENFRH